jgi:glycosyltransferase involved in cell wall biosynthesis
MPSTALVRKMLATAGDDYRARLEVKASVPAVIVSPGPMLTADGLRVFEAFRHQVRSNPALADDWGDAGDAAAAARRPERVLTILERRGVGASNIAFHVMRGLRDRGIVAQRALGWGDPGAIKKLAPHSTFDAALDVPDPRASYAALRELVAGVIDAFAPRVVVTHREFPWAWILAELRPRFPGLRVVVGCHGGPLLFRVMDTPFEAELAEALGRADLVVALSRYVRRHLEERLRLDAARLVTIRGGYDPRLFHAAEREEDAGAMRVTYVGRLEPDKAPERFVEAVLEAAVPLRATVIGDGALRPELEARAERLVADGTLRFTGSLPAADVARHLRRTDVLLVPSRSEGLGIQILEGMASGAAVVGARVGGVVELLGESEAGQLVDSTTEMAAALRRLAGDPAARRALARRGPDFLARERLDWDGVADRWAHALDGLLEP